MTPAQYQYLLNLIQGKPVELFPAFIIDCPWLPNWAGVKIIDYFSDEETWFQCHLKAGREFPEVIFLPGFWSEFGMCTEPSAFGAKCSFPENEFPHAWPVIRSSSEIDHLMKPNPMHDGLLPFMLRRLQHCRQTIEKENFTIRFSISRGPLNIASYLMGTTEFLMLMMMEPEKAHQLIRIITDFLIEWHNLQKSSIDSIDGIFLLDDIIGFLSREQFEEFGLPYFKELYDRNVSFKFLHNDAPCQESASLLAEMGINLFNMGIDVNLTELREMTGNSVTLMGNLPPRDILAIATPEIVYYETRKMITLLSDHSRILPSCGGGMPPNVSSANIRSFINAIR